MKSGADNIRKCATAIAVFAAALSAAPASAEFSAAVGGEHLNWKESTSPRVKESGMRLSVDLTWVSSREPGWSAGANVKWYAGSVDYEGAAFFTAAPLSGTTDYRGLNPEARVYYRVAEQPYAFMGAIGWDGWERKLSAAQSEDYSILYIRLGGEYNTATKQGFMGSAGVKYPVLARENAHLHDLGFSENPRIKPGKSPSLYATLGYRFRPDWDLIGYYDSFRFKTSQTVDAGGGFAVFQPKSQMDLFGVKVQHNFN